MLPFSSAGDIAALPEVGDFLGSVIIASSSARVGDKLPPPCLEVDFLLLKSCSGPDDACGGLIRCQLTA